MSRSVRFSSLLLGLFVSGAACVTAEVRSDPAAALEDRRGWTEALDWLRAESRAFAEDLEQAHTALRARAAREDQDLLARLTIEPPRARPSGYDILPEILPDAEPTQAAPRERRYSIEHISTSYAAQIRDAALLARRATRREDLPLDELVEELERLRKVQSQMQEHVAYHDFWQERVAEDSGFFAERNEIVALIRRWDVVRQRKDQPARADELRLEFEERLTQFEVVSELALREAADGTRVLPVRVLTDIRDDAFLASFEAAVKQAFVDSEAARARHFRIELELERIAPATLYPEGVPDHGASIDSEDHLDRFPEGLVLTTGASNTHAYVGRHVQLGPEPLTSRTLAHEFCHLLGFKDAYVRGFDGNPEDPFGSVIIEWVGLFDDLLGDSKGGHVSVEMIDRLLDAYGAEAGA